MERIDWKWVVISIVIFLVAQVVLNFVFTVFGILTLGFGFLIFLVAKPIIYFVGGYITGRASPGRTVLEPAIGAVVIVVAGTIFDAVQARPSGLVGTILSGLIAFFFAILGARAGERASARNAEAA